MFKIKFILNQLNTNTNNEFNLGVSELNISIDSADKLQDLLSKLKILQNNIDNIYKQISNTSFGQDANFTFELFAPQNNVYPISEEECLYLFKQDNIPLDDHSLKLFAKFIATCNFVKGITEEEWDSVINVFSEQTPSALQSLGLTVSKEEENLLKVQMKDYLNTYFKKYVNIKTKTDDEDNTPSEITKDRLC